MTKKAAAAAAQTNGQDASETVSGYFRKVFEENPALLDSRSNDVLIARWLQDHPGVTKAPDKVRQNLSNIKSVLRHKLRRKPGRPKNQGQPVSTAAAPVPKKAVKGLDTLEEHIDECLSLAKQLDRDGLAGIIILLRRARNAVVWKMGETAQA